MTFLCHGHKVDDMDLVILHFKEILTTINRVKRDIELVIYHNNIIEILWTKLYRNSPKTYTKILYSSQ